MRLVLVCSIFIIFVGIDAASLKSANVRSILEDVPEEAQKEFIKHQIIKGYMLQHDNLNVNSVSSDSTLAIYNYFKTNRLIKDSNRLTSLKDTICFPNGDCIDTDDPGVYPF